MYTQDRSFAVRDHSDLDQASHPDYLDQVDDEIDKQKILKDYASRNN